MPTRPNSLRKRREEIRNELRRQAAALQFRQIAGFARKTGVFHDFHQLDFNMLMILKDDYPIFTEVEAAEILAGITASYGLRFTSISYRLKSATTGITPKPRRILPLLAKFIAKLCG